MRMGVDLRRGVPPAFWRIVKLDTGCGGKVQDRRERRDERGKKTREG